MPPEDSFDALHSAVQAFARPRPVPYRNAAPRPLPRTMRPAEARANDPRLSWDEQSRALAELSRNRDMGRTALEGQAQAVVDPEHTPLENGVLGVARAYGPGAAYDAVRAGGRIAGGDNSADAWGGLALNTGIAALPFLGLRGLRGEPAPAPMREAVPTEAPRPNAPPLQASGTRDARPIEPQASPDANAARASNAAPEATGGGGRFTYDGADPSGDRTYTIPLDGGTQAQLRITPDGHIGWDFATPLGEQLTASQRAALGLRSFRGVAEALRDDASRFATKGYRFGANDPLARIYRSQTRSLEQHGFTVTESAPGEFSLRRTGDATGEPPPSYPAEDDMNGPAQSLEARLQPQFDGGQWHIVENGRRLRTLPQGTSARDAMRVADEMRRTRPPPTDPKSLPRRKPPLPGGFLGRM